MRTVTSGSCLAMLTVAGRLVTQGDRKWTPGLRGKRMKCRLHASASASLHAHAPRAQPRQVPACLPRGFLPAHYHRAYRGASRGDTRRLGDDRVHWASQRKTPAVPTTCLPTCSTSHLAMAVLLVLPCTQYNTKTMQDIYRTFALGQRLPLSYRLGMHEYEYACCLFRGRASSNALAPLWPRSRREGSSALVARLRVKSARTRTCTRTRTFLFRVHGATLLGWSRGTKPLLVEEP